MSSILFDIAIGINQSQRGVDMEFIDSNSPGTVRPERLQAAVRTKEQQ